MNDVDPHRVLLLAPLGDDAKILSRILSASGFETITCVSISDLCKMIEEGAGAAIIASEALRIYDRKLKDILGEQPEWSDFPIILMATRGKVHEPGWSFLIDENVQAQTIILERPVFSKTLISAVRSAIRSRKRQYNVRDELIKRIRTENQLREREERLRLAARAADFGTYDADLEENSMYWSPEMKSIMGLPPSFQPPPPGGIPELVHPADKAHVKEMLKKAYNPEGEGEYDDEHRIIKPDGEEKWVRLKGKVKFALDDGKQRAVRFSGMMLDITEKKRSDEELKLTREKLMSQEKLAAVGSLAGGVAHDLRNPMAAIKSAAYLLKMVLKDPDKDVHEALDIIGDEVSASEKIISELLDFARPKPPVRRKIELRKTVMNAISRMRVPEKIEVNVEPYERYFVFADPDQLTSAFSSIIENSIQSMEEGGRLYIGFNKIEPFEEMEVSIKDTGRGIPEDTIGKIFDPLFTTKMNGTGLGLSLAKTFMEMHGGNIQVNSEEGVGTNFLLRIPVRGLSGYHSKIAEGTDGTVKGTKIQVPKGERPFRQEPSGQYIYDIVEGKNTCVSPEYELITGYDPEYIENMDKEAFSELFPLKSQHLGNRYFK